MKTNFYCESCGKNFDNKDECLEHEKNCGIKFPVKIITINKAINEKAEIKIFTYPEAVRYGDMMKFIPSSIHMDNVYVNRLFLDKIKSLEDYYAIHTTNFDKEYEKECILKLLEYKKEVLNESLEDWKKIIQRHLNEIENKNVDIKYDENYRLMIDEYSDYDDEY